ncbi:hypothetical protein GCK72_011683 [Caenorhabditis remanei]|uniref:Uncharacterized protein n=2 Tax=Caenorhabditis remanei TaxID=31234 RepID=E3NAJ4_CAERE|nr:hypothetical protein GCK72_011683 [Caenorhabditis remanei]EFO91143.1 hypothetical protein CRE_30136 [Caenorhabditis remanei]KAF1763417.1 hypothetical protein GCK72_011683 [Caenorhabditis remanei]
MLIFSRIFTLLFVLLAIGMVADAAGSRRDRYCGRLIATNIMAACGSASCENHKEIVAACMNKQPLTETEIMDFCCPAQ